MAIVPVNPPARRRAPAEPPSQPDASASASSHSGQSTYDVGYRRPPKHSQFKPGHSGNPKGRPKRSKGLKTIVRETLGQKILVRTANGERRISHIEAMFLKLMEQAAKGNFRAIYALLTYYAQAVPEDDGPSDPSMQHVSSETDNAILASLREEILAGLSSGEEK